MAKNITNKVVLVTGAGGSIGSELCRQIIKLNPKALLIEISEFALYAIHSEIEGLSAQVSNKFDTTRSKDSARFIVPLLASVQDEDRMLEIMDAWQPDTIYHAAAYSACTACKQNISEGVKTML